MTARATYLAKMTAEYGVKCIIKDGQLGYKVTAASAKQPGCRYAAGQFIMLKDASEVPSFK